MYQLFYKHQLDMRVKVECEGPVCHVFCLFSLQWATLRIERGAKEKNHPLYKPYSNGKTCLAAMHEEHVA